MKIISPSKSKIRKITKPTLTTKRAVSPAAKKITPKARPMVVKTSAPKAKRTVKPLPAPVITSEEIARRAYFIWEQQGRPAGKEAEHWKLAEQQLKSSQSFTE